MVTRANEPGEQKVRSDYGEVSLIDVLSAVLRSWRTVLVLPISLAILVGLYTYVQDRTYSASASLMPQVQESTASEAAALAQQFGLNVRSDRSGYSPEFYVELLNSRTILRRAVEEEYPTTVDGQTQRRTLVAILGLADEAGLVPPWRRAVTRLRDRISTEVAQETGVVRFSVSASDPVLAEAIAGELLNLLNGFILDVRQHRAQEEGRFAGERVEEVRLQLEKAEDDLKAFLSRNREFRNAPELLFEHDQLQRQVTMHQEIYTSLLRAREQARIDAVRDTPLFTVIEQPAGSAQPEGRGTVQRFLIAFAFGLAIATLIASISEVLRRGRESRDPQYLEVEQLARHMWNDIQRPARWLRGPGKGTARAGSMPAD